MMIATTRFGEIEVPDDALVNMAEGLLGFEAYTEYCLLPHAVDSPFQWLQSTQEPSLAFVTIHPFDFFPDYDVTIGEVEANLLELHNPGDAIVLSLVTISDIDITANLVGPVVINMDNRKAAQIVLTDKRYTTKHTLVSAAPRVASNEKCMVGV